MDWLELIKFVIAVLFVIFCFGVGGAMDYQDYVNPIPAGLVLTGIVVSVSVTAVMLALTIRLYQRYHTLNLDEIYMQALREQEEHE